MLLAATAAHSDQAGPCERGHLPITTDKGEVRCLPGVDTQAVDSLRPEPRHKRVTFTAHAPPGNKAAMELQRTHRVHIQVLAPKGVVLPPETKHFIAYTFFYWVQESASAEATVRCDLMFEHGVSGGQLPRMRQHRMMSNDVCVWAASNAFESADLNGHFKSLRIDTLSLIVQPVSKLKIP